MALKYFFIILVLSEKWADSLIEDVKYPYSSTITFYYDSPKLIASRNTAWIISLNIEDSHISDYGFSASNYVDNGSRDKDNVELLEMSEEEIEDISTS